MYAAVEAAPGFVFEVQFDVARVTVGARKAPRPSLINSPARNAPVLARVRHLPLALGHLPWRRPLPYRDAVDRASRRTSGREIRLKTERRLIGKQHASRAEQNRCQKTSKHRSVFRARGRDHVLALIVAAVFAGWWPPVIKPPQ